MNSAMSSWSNSFEYLPLCKGRQLNICTALRWFSFNVGNQVQPYYGNKITRNLGHQTSPELYDGRLRVGRHQWHGISFTPEYQLIDKFSSIHCRIWHPPMKTGINLHALDMTPIIHEIAIHSKIQMLPRLISIYAALLDYYHRSFWRMHYSKPLGRG